ncbi:MAG: NTP transferase domain-containing protein [Actinobacteria bacterium]|nr:NTP transferase domain-containing protein [Actinomycetota bacterium]
MRYAIIMAGGSGTRLWPLSRKSRPKQLLRIFGQSSLLSLSVKRLQEVVEASNIYVLTNADYASAVRDELHELPAENVIGEPQGRDTANAIGLAAAILNEKDPEAVMGVFTADHMIEPIDVFGQTVTRAFELAEKYSESLITFGIKPTWAHTGLGYVQAGEPVTSSEDDYQAFKVRSFKEKPSSELAQEYLDSGQHYWNSGMFVWGVRTILDQLQQFLPESYKALQEIAADWGKDGGEKTFQQIFPTLQKISIDYAVMEKAQNVLMVALPCQWVDMGSWSVLSDVLPMDKEGNVASAAAIEFLDSRNNVIVSEDENHLLALIGLEDVIVVHSAEATLICHKSQAQAVKDLVARMERQGRQCL